MTTFYVVEGKQIINAIEASSRERAEQTLKTMSNHQANGFYLLEHPPIVWLESYRYWNERP